MEFVIPSEIFGWPFWISAVACYVISEAVKQAPKIPSWGINVINLAVGALLYTALTGAWDSPANYVFGLLAASVADIAYQLFKNVVSKAGE